jgi:hypothetical protein
MKIELFKSFGIVSFVSSNNFFQIRGGWSGDFPSSFLLKLIMLVSPTSRFSQVEPKGGTLKISELEEKTRRVFSLEIGVKGKTLLRSIYLFHS